VLFKKLFHALSIRAELRRRAKRRPRLGVGLADALGIN